jgi:23S rRNA (cytidine1920-2'-O)/16S rRNA (cytidine1409-2'-O)-methyltransferase
MRKRLDQVLVERGLAATRSRARDLVLRACVRADGAVVTKPGQTVAATASLAVEGGGEYVSRGALKLEAAIEVFGFEAKGRIALDLGASAGGFTEVLLARGAAKVYAVDVGTGQLDPRLKRDPRVVALEKVDARSLSPELVPDPVGAIVADVSFISLTKALPAALALAAPGAWLVALVKPQFEAGRKAVGKGGIVRDAKAREAAVGKVRQWVGAQAGWHVVGVVPSPIAGGSGNVEFLLGAAFDG